MRRVSYFLAGCLGMGLLGGCRTATHVREVPRVDLDLTHGNRGFLVGTAAEGGQLKTTRQMIQTDIEIPTYYQPKAGGRPVRLPSGASGPVQTVQPMPESEAVTVGGASPETGPYDTYAVQKGDSLWSIAAQPSIYGKATAWRRIFDANRDLLKGDANNLRAGMTLKIPRGASRAGSSSLSGKDSGMTFTK